MQQPYKYNNACEMSFSLFNILKYLLETFKKALNQINNKHTGYKKKFATKTKFEDRPSLNTFSSY